MKLAFKMMTIGGGELNNLDAENFSLSLMKSGKRIKSKTAVSAPVKSASTGNWVIKLEHTSTPVIGELVLRGSYHDSTLTPPVLYDVPNPFFHNHSLV